MAAGIDPQSTPFPSVPPLRHLGGKDLTRVIICGGGLAGSLAATAIAKRRPDVDLLLIEKDRVFGGNHIWSFFDTDIPEQGRWLLDLIASRRWPDHEVRFPRRSRVIPVGYNSIQSHDLDAAVRTALAPHQYRLGTDVSDLGPNHVDVGGERVSADCVIDARGPRAMPGLNLGWQKFVGRVYRFPERHGVGRPVIMDATVAQLDGYRFAYLLPLSATELLIEDTYYSSSSLLLPDEIGTRIDALAARIANGRREIVSEEHGVLPVLVDGTLEQLWPASDAIPRLGLFGGFFHPTTGYSLPDALANAAVLADSPDLGTAAVRSLLHGRAERLWHERHFFQLLNRMLFRAAEPDRRYRVLEHFYRLPPALISRFYAARLTRLDKLRILSGMPPVPLTRALSALFRKAA